ncbi:regulator of G protein signaling [Auriscalpium vulgare]|uniref:Regulator of G protein signaling n=1 Tax=Auriscalpium vulgare TaxID=40419 RepID=A0ACB8S8R2_9AGAM|nr:regulator of G protein signaling [Auriscalpium vulgare]
MPTTPSPQQDASPQASSSHMMKTTKRGRPFLKDTLDLFATLIVSLQLTHHKQFFRSFPNSFSTDEAAANLASLKFSQSNRGPDPREPSRVITTTTTTTFSMTRDMAKAMSQHFMDARLIENAADPSSNLFKDRGVYVLTPKGLHVLERFISRNGINGDHLAHVFASQPICMKLLHLERRSVDDEIIVSQSVITALFRRFVGRQQNYTQPAPQPADPTQAYHDRSRGIQLMDIQDKQIQGGKTQTITHRYCFAALAALEWLCDFTSVVGREEAAEMAAQFVRFGLIVLVSDKRKNNDSAIIFTVRGSAPGGNSPVMQTGEFRCTAKAIYKITEEGIRTARWDSSRNGTRDSPNSSSANLVTERSSLEDLKDAKKLAPADAKIHRRISLAEKMNASYDHSEKRGKESNTERLRFIIDQPNLRGLFREFLRDNFCEENLSFWLEVEDFKRKFNITSSATSALPSRPMAAAGIKANTPGQAAMEQHHEALIHQAFFIYHTYLAPSSQCELNIDHGLRNELSAYLSEVMTALTGAPFQGRLEQEQLGSFNATQLQTMIQLYGRIQTHVFRLMATDSVPKFTKTPQFMLLRSKNDDYDFLDSDVQYLSNSGPAVPPGLDQDAEEVGGAYVTVSQQAGERARKREDERERDRERGWNERL